MSQAAYDAGRRERLGLARLSMPVKNARKIGKRDIVRNSGTPTIKFSPETFAVTVDACMRRETT